MKTFKQFSIDEGWKDYLPSMPKMDDVYATGGTMNAAVELCQKAGYNVVGELVFIDLVTLHGPTDVKSLIQYE